MVGLVKTLMFLVLSHMRKVYYLPTCSTCKRIMDDLGSMISDFEKQDIKTDQMTFEQVDQMKTLSGSYESLFSRKAMKFRSMGLADQSLTEEDYRQWIQQEYTFLKRPVFIVNDQIFIGNSAKTIDQLKAVL